MKVVVAMLVCVSAAFGQGRYHPHSSWSPTTYIGVEYGLADDYRIIAQGDLSTQRTGIGPIESMIVQQSLSPISSISMHFGVRDQITDGLHTKYYRLCVEADGGFDWGPFFASGLDLSVLHSSIATGGDHDSNLVPYHRGLAVGLLSSCGWNISMGPVELSPAISWNVPLSTITDLNALHWRITSIFYSLALKYGIED